MDAAPPQNPESENPRSENPESENPEFGESVPVDLDLVERDLDDVQAALVRLNDGHYWNDEITGEPLPDDYLADNPTARTVTSPN